MTIALISNFHNIFLNDMMHTGLISAGMDVLPITANEWIAAQETAAAANMPKRALENLPQTQNHLQGIS